MTEIQLAGCFTDHLESIRVGGKKMEIPKAEKAKPVEEWFEPAAGRLKWGGLGAEIKEMEFGREKDTAYSFLMERPGGPKAGVKGVRGALAPGRGSTAGNSRVDWTGLPAGG
jgi:hypothetical protein